MAEGFPSWVPPEAIPEWAAQRAGQFPQMQQEAGLQPAPQGAPIPTMSQFPTASQAPTVADLYPGAMGQSYLRSRGYDISRVHPSQVPLQGKEIEQYHKSMEAQQKGWEAERRVEMLRDADRRMAETERRNAEMERRAQAKVDAAEQTAAEKEAMLRDSSLRRSEIVIGAAKKGLQQTNVFTAGLLGTVLNIIPGTPARNLERTVDTIKAQIGFDELQRMREASPTGGALGQIAVRELDFLQAAIASLSTDQTPAQLRENFRKVQGHFTNWRRVMQEQASGAKPGAPQPPGGGGGGDPLNLRGPR